MNKEELEQEAEEFVCSKKSFWKQGRTCVESVRQAYIASGEPREKRIAELEKENAELKDKLNNLSSVAEVRLANWQKCKGQLTKAKFLLKQLVDAFPKSYSDVVKDTLGEARKFVEVEK